MPSEESRPSRHRLQLRLAVAAVVITPMPSSDARAAIADFRPTWASWYGPGLWGNPLGCGGTLWYGTMGVAHKTIRCGTRLRVCARRCATVRVIDRGPFVAGREFDLTQALARKIQLRVRASGAGRVRVRHAETDLG